MIHDSQDTAFDAWLSRQLQADRDYLDDDGFTDAVMAAVPPASRRRSLMQALLWPTCLALSGTAASLGAFAGLGTALSAFTALATLPLSTLLLIGALTGLAVSLAGSVILWAALRAP